MKTTAALLIGAGIMMMSYAHAGFNGNQNVQGNHGNASGAGNSDFGQCINGQGKMAGNVQVTPIQAPSLKRKIKAKS